VAVAAVAPAEVVDAVVELVADQTVMAGTEVEPVAVAERTVVVSGSRYDRTAKVVEPGVVEKE